MEEFLTISRATAAGLQQQFDGDPEAELAAWLDLALEREGMVSRLYGSTGTKRLLANLGSETKKAAKGVWADEQGHAAYLQAVQDTEAMIVSKPRMTKLWGELQGIVTAHATTGGTLGSLMARVLMRIGAKSIEKKAVAEIQKLDDCGFCFFSHILEVTAVEGYDRMLQPLSGLRTPPPLDFGLELKLLRVLSEERAHRDLFGTMWFRNRCSDPDDPRSVLIAKGMDPTVLAAITKAPSISDAFLMVLQHHMGAASDPDLSVDADDQLAADYWQWRIANPFAISYLVQKQGLDLASHGRRVVLMGPINLATLVADATVIDLDDEMIEQFRFKSRMFESAGEMVLSAGSS